MRLNNLKQKYINSAVLLLAASVIVKIISAVYKIPLTAFIGATGRGYFNTAYNIFMPMHAVIMGALPVALTHLISKYREKNDPAKVYKINKGASLLFFMLGIAGTALMLLLARPYARKGIDTGKRLLRIKAYRAQNGAGFKIGRIQSAHNIF